MRGKHEGVRVRERGMGITPADAGKTYREMRKKISRQDHPRGCGENLFFVPCDAAVAGSPPRMRGKQTVHAAPYGCKGITPADAGKTRIAR